MGPFIVLSMRGCQLGFKVATFEVATFVTITILYYKSFYPNLTTIHLILKSR
jgi:hypothetical protein